MPDFITEFKFRDDALPYDPSFGAPSFSPYNYVDGIRQDVAVYAISGWMDGAGYANGAHRAFPVAARTSTSTCCSARGTTARASTSRRGATRSSREFTCWPRCCASSTSI